MSQKKNLYAIDVMAMAFRCYHAFGMRPLLNSDGLQTSVVYGSMQFLLRLIDREPVDYLCFCSDSREPTFRHKMYSEYKANRDEMPEDLALQLPYLFQLFDFFKVPTLKTPGYEADDLLGTLAVKHASENQHVYIVSGDKDFMQLINPNVSMYAPKKAGKHLIVNEAEVFEKFGCKPSQVIDALAIIGDSSDNVPGVRGIGEKGAAKLISAYGGLDNIYANLEEITNKRQKNSLSESKEMAYLSKDLVTIKTDCEIESTFEDYRLNVYEVFQNPEFREFCEFMNFSKILERFDFSAPASATTAAKPEAVKKTKKSAETEEAEPVDIEDGRDFSGYKLVDTKAGVSELMGSLKNSSIFSFDTETTGLSKMESEPIGFSCSFREGEAYYLPLIEKHLENDLTAQDARNAVEEIMGLDVAKVAHNAKFDLHMLANIGIQNSQKIEDSMMAAHLLMPGKRGIGLDDQCFASFNYKKIPTTALMGEKKKTPIEEAELGLLKNYACEDADYTLRLHHELQKKLQAKGLEKVYRDWELPLLPVIVEMERSGVFIDQGELESFSVELAEAAYELEKEIYAIAGEEFNIKSPKQLQVILFEKLKVHEKLGVKRLKKTKSGFSTDVSVLERLSEHPVASKILEYRTVGKLNSTYVQALPKMVNGKSGRIHASFNQFGTATGRLSSNDPNLQNIPIRTKLGRRIRESFKPQNKDSLIISADYSQMELRVLAHLAKEEDLGKAFKSGEDIHRSTASKIFGVEVAEVNDAQRSQAKAINFGIIYGMGSQRLSRETGVSLREAKEFIQKYFDSYPRIHGFIEKCKEEAHSTGEVRTISGRLRQIEELDSTNVGRVIAAENMAVNTPVQGSAADITKMAMIKIHKQLKAEGLNSKLIMQVHDELVFEVPKSELEKMKVLIKETMEQAVELDTPLAVEVGAGSNWLEAH